MYAKILVLANLLWSAFFRPVVGSVNGALIPAEIKKAILAGLGASTLVGGAIAGLNAVKPDLPSLFTSPVAAAAASMIIVQLIGLLGQVNQTETGQRMVRGIYSHYLTGVFDPPAVVAAIPQPGPVVLAALKQQLIGHGEARKLLFPELAASDVPQPPSA